jgi:putative hydrolase of the HAD superfamily
MIILANWDKTLNMIVRELGIDQYFMEILSSEEIKMEKPDPEVFHYALRIVSVSPERSIYVGNEYETDVIGSRSAGLVPVLIDRNRFWPHADCLRFESLLDMGEYLKR